MELDQYLISEDSNLLEALEKIDLGGKKVLYVTKDNKLVAAITDGDIRRWILKKGDLNAHLNKIANYSPKFVYESELDKISVLMQKFSVESIPILSHSGEVKSIKFTDSLVNRKEKIDASVVVMAGGLGTRLLPYTKILPKPLIPIGDKTILERILDRFTNYDIQDFKVILNYKGNMIKAYFEELSRYNLEYYFEKEPLGTGGGLSLLKNKISKPFFLTNCDILVNADYSDIYNFHIKNENYITMVTSVKSIEIPYGVVNFDSNGTITSMEEKPKLSRFLNTGFYVVNPDLIKELSTQKVDFTEIIEKFQIQGKKIGVYPIGENNWKDMGEMNLLNSLKKDFGDFDV